MQLTDRLYTSTEVAEILGVSLRSVYRYLEDGKLIAEVKTATGRHRFTKENIINFLYPDGVKTDLFEDENKQEEKVQPSKKEFLPKLEPVVEKPQVEPVKEKEIEEEPVDWLAKFREAATKYKQAEEANAYSQNIQTEPVVSQRIEPQMQQQPYQPIIEPQTNKTEEGAGPTLMYYRSMLGGLKDIAQNLDKSARNSNLDYAFTLNAGASLHKPIKPFAILHAYIRSSDRDFFEKILRLTPANKTNAQLCLVLSDNQAIQANKKEVHGLYVVSNDQLKKDIATFGDAQLAQEIADIL
ncbi:hypothetical protein A2V49_02100 [candidate division WWE3 bacterium RBG_19FT_COMBO_34_6]|uniref:Helix-turn-helix domain-containing protein n=1 Tax=candidate division WWE3 bacterium RBG_19FT_COMBO_34_6 TaxID=1802612 RepID=A0A1F4UK19_UNCKA|nr:MAG: hypothetical protein A2V49_02100 [candidate division WWE3 bacterium RBG_19FT_COMBO_34_6]